MGPRHLQVCISTLSELNDNDRKYSQIQHNKAKQGPKFMFVSSDGNKLAHKQLETHGCILRIVASDALVLKHQDISINGAN